MLSIGTAGGIISGFEEFPDGGGLIRLGNSLLWVDPEQYRLWDAGLLAPTTPALLQWAAGAGLDKAEELLSKLVGDHLMVKHARDPDGLLRQATGHAVRFIGYCIGNGPGRSPRFLVKSGADGSSVLAVDVALYQFLLWADGTASIAEQCAQHDIDGLPDGTDPGIYVTERLPILLRAGVISLDIANQSRVHE